MNQQKMNAAQAKLVLKLMAASVAVVPVFVFVVLTLLQIELFAYSHIVMTLLAIMTEATAYLFIKKHYIKRGVLPDPRNTQSERV